MEVYALIGPSGSGKSHRALLVATRNEIRHIIDDGLLIAGDGKILAGRSAKRETTGPAAVKRALFVDPEHAAGVRDVLTTEAPDRLLLLGTSQRMVERIAEALELPAICQVIDIEDVASPADIRRAHSIRRHMGRHVIPAPTLEVKKSFSGYLVDSLRLFSRGQRLDGGRVIEKSIVRPTYSSLGHFFISDRVVTTLAEHAVRGVAGVCSVGRIRVDLRDEGVMLDIGVGLRYGSKLVEVCRLAQERCREEVEHMTALNVLAVNVTAQRLVVAGAGADEGGVEP